MRDELLAAVVARVERIEQAQDLSGALEPRALEDARRLAGILRHDDGDVQARYALGRLHWYRYIASPEGEGRDDWNAALRAFTPCFIAGLDLPGPLLPALADASVAAAVANLEEAVSSTDLTLITAAVELWQRIVTSTPSDHPDRAGRLSSLRVALRARFGRTGVLEDLNAAITAAQAAVAATPTGDDIQAMYGLGELHLWRYLALLGEDDWNALGAAFTPCFIAGLDLPGPLLPALADASVAAAVANLEEAVSSTDLTLITAAVELWQRIVTSTPSDHPDRAGRLSSLGIALHVRSRRTGALEDLNAAITACRESVAATDTDHPARAGRLSNLGEVLRTRFERTGALEDLNAAITACREAVATVGTDHPDRAEHLSSLGSALATRFERTGALEDLNAAITACRESVAATDTDHPARAGRLSNLSDALRVRFERTGVLEDVNAAITAAEGAVTATPADHSGRAGYLSNLGNALERRFERTGALEDLNAAIFAFRESVRATPADHPDRATSLSNLGTALRVRSERTGALEDLNAAITACRESVAATDTDHPARAGRLSNLGTALRALSERTGALEDLNAAITACREAVAATPADHPNRATYLSNLGSALATRFERTGALGDLNAAITACREAVAAAATTDHPNRAAYLQNLGNALATRFQRTGSDRDKGGAISAYAQVVDVASAAPSIRIRAAWVAAWLAAPSDARRAAGLLDTAVRLLPETAPRQLDRGDQQYALGGFAGLASDAAALALAVGDTDETGERSAARALQLLELGRAVLHSQALDTRSDLTDLQARAPALAGRFIELRDQLDTESDVEAATTAPADGADMLEDGRVHDRHRAAAEFAATVAEIRGLGGFEGFLLPPGPDELILRAKQGPVVVFNVSRYRSDAVLLTKKGISHVPLRGLAADALIETINAFQQALYTAHDRAVSGEERENAQHALSEVLEWLWNIAAEPVLDKLGYVRTPGEGTDWPRVWWAPGGLLGLLPIHAAGHHREPPGSDGRRTVMDRVVSSYTPTVRALAHARDHDTTPAAGERALIVAMPTTPGASLLRHVAEEAAMLQEFLPQPTVLIEGTDAEHTPTKAKVLAHLTECAIAHFACHGSSNPADPSQSLLLLHDYLVDPLTVASLAPIRLDQARLAYLSACRTAFNASSDLVDEAIHLAAAFQLAGYPHVIGTFWEIDDAIAVRVARAFYTALNTTPSTFDTCRAAEALHHAVRAVRDRLPATSSLWASYMHFGV